VIPTVKPEWCSGNVVVLFVRRCEFETHSVHQISEVNFFGFSFPGFSRLLSAEEYKTKSSATWSLRNLGWVDGGGRSGGGRWHGRSGGAWLRGWRV
jgi:hypothetical protein